MHTQEDNWEKEFDVEFGEWLRAYNDGEETEVERKLKSFITRTRQEAYEKGRKDAREEALDWIENNPEFPTPRIYEVAKIMTFLQVSIRAASAPKQT